MASLVLGAAGAFVGSFFGPLGTSIGWAIGSAIGSSIGQKGTEGPRLTDLKLQTSAYGSAIPIHYGTVRAAGASVIWQTDLVEHKHESGGKGGPTNTNFTYTASFAVMLCEGPIIGLKSIWADNRLIWLNGQSTIGTELPFVLYLGTTTQLPDPTIQAAEGAANVTAHRGYAYIVFTDLELAEFFNRIPQFTFEIHATGDVELLRYATWNVDTSIDDGSTTYSFPQSLSGQVYDHATGNIIAHRWLNGGDYPAPPLSLTNGVIYHQTRIETLQGALLSTVSDSINLVPVAAGPSIISSLNSEHCYIEYQFTGYCEICTGDTSLHYLNNAFITPKADGAAFLYCELCTAGIAGTGKILGINGTMWFHNGFLYATGGGLTDDPNQGGPGTWVRRWPCNADRAVASIHYDRSFQFSDSVSYPFGPYGEMTPGSGFDVTVGDDGFIYVMGTTQAGTTTPMWKLDRDLNLVNYWVDVTGVGGMSSAIAGQGFAIFQGHLFQHQNTNPVYFNPARNLYKINDDDTFTFVDYDIGSVVTPLISFGNGYVAARDCIYKLGGETTLAAIVTDISGRVGWTPADIDVTDIPDPVHGYTIGQQMVARAGIEGLMPAFRFDATESDRTVKFVKRGHPSVATITNADLGTTRSDPVPLLTLIRTQEAELPRRIYVKYFNLGAAYQDGTQVAQRVVTDSELDVTVNLAVVMTDSEAKICAETLLVSAWAERNRFQISTPRKFGYLEPTDVVTAQNYPMRLTNKSEDGGVVSWDAVGTLEAVYTQIAPAVTPLFVPQPPDVPQPTDLEMLDIPLVRDADYPNGFYVAMAGSYRTDWRGAELFKSSDGGSNYSSIATALAADTIGASAGILGDSTGGNVFDEINTVSVQLNAGAGTLSSLSELGVLNGGNMALLGDEIIQFKTATLTAALTYTLSGLLRGRRGTEWATGDHVGNERFVMLPTVTNINATFAELGLDRMYKQVTIGDTLSSVTATTFANNGIALKPYAPANIGGGRNAAGDITITWNRRTRIGGAWKDYVDCPVSEAIESYQLTFYTDGTFATTAYASATTAQTYTLTAANQTTFYGGLQTTLYVGISQDGSYQPGYEAQGSV